MKNVFVIHGYNGDTSNTFGPYIKNECEKYGVECYFPIFPIRQEATFENWKEVMDKFLQDGLINKDTILVAHSLGTLFIPKYISVENLEINTFISIAGFVDDNSGRDDLRIVVDRFKPSKDDFENLIKLTQNRYSIYSDNDHLNPQNELERYAEKIQAEKIFIKNKGHFGRKSGVKELPEVMEIIKKI